MGLVSARLRHHTNHESLWVAWLLTYCLLELHFYPSQSPLTAIQAFAKAEYIAQIPGMEWILTAGGGSVSQFVNGYLPVAALLALTMVLPLIFQFLATNYEKRKLLSDVQNSMLGRYFYFQCLNLYISVTAGGVWKSLSDIIDHPTSILILLGESLPFMVGYFVSLLVTKVLVGLPMIFLRAGALSKMCLRRMLSSSAKLTQRELDEMYSPENVLVSFQPKFFIVNDHYICTNLLFHSLVFATKVWMGVSCTDFRHHDYLHICSYLSGDSAFRNHVLHVLSRCIQETNFIRLSACI